MEQHLHYRGARKRRQRKMDRKCLWGGIAENFPNLGKEIVSQAMEVYRCPNTRDPRRTTPRYIIIKMIKIKDKDSIKGSQGEKKRSPIKENPSSYHEISQQKPYRPEENDMIYLVQWNKRALNQEYCIKHDYHLNMKEGLNNSQTSKSWGNLPPTNHLYRASHRDCSSWEHS